MRDDDARQRLVSYLEHQAEKDVPRIVELIEEQRGRLLALLDGVPDEQAAFRPAPDQWSIADVLRHVIAAEEGVARIVESLARGVVPGGSRAPGGPASGGRSAPEEGRSPLARLKKRLCIAALAALGGALLASCASGSEAPAGIYGNPPPVEGYLDNLGEVRPVVELS